MDAARSPGMPRGASPPGFRTGSSGRTRARHHEGQAKHHDDRRGSVGEHMAQERARPADTARAGRLDEVLLAQREYFGPDDPRVAPPAREAEDDDVAPPTPGRAFLTARPRPGSIRVPDPQCHDSTACR